jgi:hypothetical protein
MFAAGSLLAADSNPKDDVTSAATALGNQSSYSWQTTVDMGSGSPFQPGPQLGKTEKDGYTSLSVSMGDNSTLLLMKGTNVAIKTDSGWQSMAEASADGGGPNPARFAMMMTSGFKTPAEQAADLLTHVKDLAAGTNGITGALTDEGAKAMLAFRRGRGGPGGPGGPGGGEGPAINNAKGTATFWITDGKLVKFQSHVTGTMNFGGEDRDMDRTTTTEIKDLGTTKVEVPDDAKKKLQ